MSELTVAGQKIGRIPDASSPELLPPEAPLEMPDQDFKARTACQAAAPPRLLGSARGGVHRRGVLTAAFAYELYGVLAVEQATPLQFLFLILSTIAFGWIALGSLNAALGFIPLFGGEKADTIDLPLPGAPLDDAHRAAVPRLSRGSGAHRRHGAGDRARAGIDGRARRRSTSLYCPTRATSARARPRRAPIAPCATASRTSSRSTTAAAARTAAARPATSRIGCAASAAAMSTSSFSTATASCPARHSCAWRSPCSATSRPASSRRCRASPARRRCCST